MGKESAFGAVLRNRALRRLQYAVLGSMLGRMAFIVGIAVWAYDAGGPALVGLAGFARMAPTAIVSPFAATFADRYPRERVMAASDLGRALLCLAIAAAVAADAPPAIVLVLLVLIALLASLFEPARAAIVPSLVDRPELLTASNAVSSAVNSAAYFLGPAVGAFLLAVSSVEVTFVFTAIALVWSAAFALTLHPRAPEQPAAAEPAGWLDDVREGVVRRPRGPRPPAAPRPVRRADADRGRPQRVHRRHRTRPARCRATPGWASWTPRAASAR